MGGLGRWKKKGTGSEQQGRGKSLLRNQEWNAGGQCWQAGVEGKLLVGPWHAGRGTGPGTPVCMGSAELRLQWGEPPGPGFLIEPDHQAWEHSHAQAVPVDKHTSEWASHVAQW